MNNVLEIEMAMPVDASFSDDRLSWIRRLISQVQESNELRDYLEEIERCLHNHAYRAAVVLGWSVVTYSLRQTIDLVGFNQFSRTALELAEAPRLHLIREDAGNLGRENWEDGRRKDQDFLRICQTMGIIEEREIEQLKRLSELYNTCVHPRYSPGATGVALSILQYALEQISTTIPGGWYLPVAFFEQLLRSEVNLNTRELQTLMGLLRKSEYSVLISKLVNRYYDPDPLIGSEEPEKEDITSTIRRRIRILWDAIARKLDDDNKMLSNNKLAEFFQNTLENERDQVPWRDFIFWEQWEQTDTNLRDIFAVDLILEFKNLVTNSFIESIDLNRLIKITRHLESKMRHKNVQIFLCCIQADENKVEYIYQALMEKGFTPWMSSKDVPLGGTIQLFTEQSLLTSDFCLIFLSRDSLSERSEFQRYMKRALDLFEEKLSDDIFLIPIRLDNCEMPASLKKFRSLDLFEFEGDGLKQLVQALHRGRRRRSGDLKPSGQGAASSELYIAEDDLERVLQEYQELQREANLLRQKVS